MSEAAELPRQPWLPDRDFREPDLAAFPEDGHRYEIVDGSLYVSPPPSIRHQLVSGRLSQLLRAAATAEYEVLDTVGVRVEAGLLVPDLVIADAEAAFQGGAAFAAASIAVAVEIVSPSSVTMDKLAKPVLYAAARIPGYWRVEPDRAGGVLITAYELAGGAYRQVGEAAGDSELVVERPFPVVIRPSALLSR
jgi:Uma2 family endonuclease